jgi:nucleotide-binding universal stress UspA family protein
MKELLVAVDFSDATDRVLDVVTDLAGALSAHVRLLHVAEPNPEFVGYEVDPPALRDEHARAYRQEHRSLQEMADVLRGRGIDTKALLIQGGTVDKILEEAERTDSDLVVVGTHGHAALYRALLGSVSEGLLRESKRPLLIVPSRPA